jgi:hypothetical protein
MTTRFSLLALLALPLLSAAQNTELGRTNDGNFNNGYAMIAPDAGQVHGSPFLVMDWLPGTVQLIGNTVPTSTTLRYDVYRQELRVRRPKGDSVVVPLNRIKEFTLTNSRRRFVCYPPATLPAEVSGACAEMLADGPHLQLLKFWHKELVKQPIDNGSYASTSTMNVLEETSRYYLRWPADGHLTVVRLKRSSLEQVLAGQPAALAALKARKGSLSAEADLVAAVLALDPVVTAGH